MRDADGWDAVAHSERLQPASLGGGINCARCGLDMDRGGDRERRSVAAIIARQIVPLDPRVIAERPRWRLRPKPGIRQLLQIPEMMMRIDDPGWIRAGGWLRWGRHARTLASESDDVEIP